MPKENEQEIRLELRERYLKAVANLNGKQCSFHMHGGKVISGEFKGADIEFNNILVDKLNDPSIKSKNAIFRATDVVYMRFDKFTSR